MPSPEKYFIYFGAVSGSSGLISFMSTASLINRDILPDTDIFKLALCSSLYYLYVYIKIFFKNFKKYIMLYYIIKSQIYLTTNTDTFLSSARIYKYG